MGDGSGAGPGLDLADAGVLSARRAEARIRATRLEQALDWAAALEPSPLRIATSCCGMSMVQGGDPFEALGTGPPAVSARSADLLIVAGSITRRQAPLVEALYERMLEPRWVIAWGACAISGGAYANYATVHGLARLVPVDLVVPGCPPVPTALREALEWLRSGLARPRPSGSATSRERSQWPLLRDQPPRPAAEPVRSARDVGERIDHVDRG